MKQISEVRVGNNRKGTRTAPYLEVNRMGSWVAPATTNKCLECSGYRCYFLDPYYDVVVCSGDCGFESYHSIGD